MDNRHYQSPLAQSFQPSMQNGYVDKLRFCNTKMFLILVALGWGSLSCGYSAYPNSLPDSIMSIPDLLNIAVIDLVYYISDLGGIFGALAAGFLCDRYGRRPAIMIGATINLVGNAVSAASVNLAMFLVFRFLTGFGVAIMLVAIPVLIAEIAPPKGRAILVSIHPVLFLLGSALRYWVALPWFRKGQVPNLWWRTPLAVSCAWPFLCLLCSLYLPESPRQLLMKGQDDRAWKVVSELHSKPKIGNHHYVQLEFEQMRQQIRVERTLGTGYAKLFSRSRSKRLLIGCGLNFSVLTSGVYVIGNYSVQLYEVLGHSGTEVGTYLRIAAYDNALFGMSILSLLVVELMPRRSFIALGFLGCGLSLIAQTRLFAIIMNAELVDPSLYPGADTVSRGTASAAIAVSYIFGFFYVVFLHGSRFFYIPEIFATPNRAKGMALAILTLSVTNVLWNAGSFYALRSIGWKFCIIFLVVNAIACLLVIRTFPDTRKLPLEDIGRLFGDFGSSGNTWEAGQPANANANPWDYVQPVNADQNNQGNLELDELQYNQRPSGVAGNHKPEQYGMHPAEVAGQGRYEMAK